MIEFIVKGDTIMRYGKYKGYGMVNIPPDYLLYLLNNNMCSGPVKKYIEDNKEVLEFQVKQLKRRKR